MTGKMDFRRLYEIIVFLELRRRFQLQKSISYWKNSSGHEVDLVVFEGYTPESAFQVVDDMDDEKPQEGNFVQPRHALKN